MNAATWARRRLAHPGLLAGVVVAAAVGAIVEREDVAAVLLSGVVVGFGLSGSV
ncbi:MAG: hypothetical protein M3O70_04820 [Actinomycetota bacterium]|nr:hypothetical protein [Actinomycetota bacterium]